MKPLLDLFKSRTHARAACPQCRGTVLSRRMTAWYVGGDGDSIKADKAGEIVACCACAHVFTVLASGDVLPVRRPEPAPASRFQDRGARDSGRVGYDNDLDTLSAD